MTDQTQATAPAATNGSAADDKRAQVAKHELLMADGRVTTRMEEATGIRYTVVATGKSFEYQTGGEPGNPLTMLAVFGAKTKATNEASSHRQAVQRGDDVDGDEYDSVEDAFVNIDGGVWREKAAGVSRGPKYDNAILAFVLHAALGTSAKGDVAHYADRLEADKGYRAKVVGRDDIKAAYWAEAAKRGQAKPSAAPADSLA